MNFGAYAFAVTWAPGSSTAWDALAAPAGPDRCQITRGRSSDLGQMEMGRMVLTIPDEARTYDPSNAGSGLVAPGNLRPLRFGQAVVTPTGGSATPLFSGYLSRVWANADAANRQATLEFVDGFWLLAHAYPVVPPAGLVRVGTAIGLVLNTVGIAGGLQDLDLGGWTPEFAADGSRSALDVVAGLVEVDQGAFFCAAAGTFTYRDRSSRVGRARGTPVATLAVGALSAQVPGFDVAAVVNSQRAQAQRTQTTVNDDGTTSTSLVDLGAAQVVTDASYLGVVQAGTPVASVYLRDETHANSLAQHLVATRKQGDTPVRDAVVPGLTLAQVQTQVALELSSAVTLSGVGVASEGLIERIQHDVDRRDGHRTTYAVSSRPGYAFTIGYSTVGGSDLMGY